MDCMQLFTISMYNFKECFNTASGMDCMQLRSLCRTLLRVSFQYRKRYGLHAIGMEITLKDGKFVSIPQAVWIACNKKAVRQK